MISPHKLRIAALFTILIFASAARVRGGEGDARDQMVEHARQSALRELAALETFLAQGGTSVVEGWRRELRLAELAEELTRAEPDPVRLTELWRGFRAPIAGLEAKKFITTRARLRDYITIVSTPPGDLRALQADVLAEHQRQLSRYRASESRDDAHDLGRTLAWMELTGGDRGAVEAARKEFSYPNAYFRVSTRLPNYFLARSVDERERVTAVIAGATTSGDAHTFGNLTLNTALATGSGAIDIALTGKTLTDNSVAQRGRVTVYGGAETLIDARVRLWIEEDKLRADPPQVQCTTSSRIDDIAAGSRLVERIAWRRAPRELPAAEAAAARQVEQKISERLAAETNKLVARANELYAEEMQKPLTRLGAWPQLRFASDAQALELRAVQRDNYQIAAPSAPPRWPVAGDLTFAVHESMPENIVESLLGGREMKDEQFLSFLQLLTGESPRPLWVHDREPRWSVMLADQRPLRVGFHQGRIRLTLAIEETIRGEQRYKLPALVSATFTPSATTDGPALTREGDVAIEFPEREENSATAAELHKFLSRKFTAVLPQELHFDGLAAPAGGFGDKLNCIKIEEVRTERAWLTVRYVLQTEKQPVQWVTTK